MGKPTVSKHDIQHDNVASAIASKSQGLNRENERSEVGKEGLIPRAGHHQVPAIGRCADITASKGSDSIGRRQNLN